MTDIDPRFTTFVDEFVAAYATGPATAFNAETRTVSFPIGRVRYGFTFGSNTDWIAFARSGGDAFADPPLEPEEFVPFAILATFGPTTGETHEFNTFCDRCRTLGDSATRKAQPMDIVPIPDEPIDAELICGDRFSVGCRCVKVHDHPGDVHACHPEDCGGSWERRVVDGVAQARILTFPKVGAEMGLFLPTPGPWMDES